MRLTKIALTIAALTAASGAAMGQSLNPNTAPTDLLAVFTDTANNDSVIQDLGAGTAASFNYNSLQNFTVAGGQASLLTDLGLTSATSGDIRFQVLAASNINPTQAIDFTASQPNTVLADSGPVFFNQDVINATGALGTFLGGNASSFASVNGYQQLTGDASHTGFQIYGPSGVVLGYFQTPSKAGDTVDFFTSLSDGNVNDNPTTAKMAGEFGYTYSSDTLTWTPNAVPLPPAVWMLLSGLLGVGAIGRRRGISAA